MSRDCVRAFTSQDVITTEVCLPLFNGTLLASDKMRYMRSSQTLAEHTDGLFPFFQLKLNYFYLKNIYFILIYVNVCVC